MTTVIIPAHALLVTAIITMAALPALAQTEPGGVPTAEAELFAAEGLSEADTADDLAAEALPTTDRVAFWWENMRHRALLALTFNTEQKAARYRLHLHQLDRKMAACAEIGDETCADRIQQRITALEQRAQRFMERREALRDELQEKFLQWREQRAKRREEWRSQAAERRGQLKELLQQRRQRRRDAMQHRRETMQTLRQQLKERRQLRRQQRQELRDMRQENRQERKDLREQNREKLIELRSKNVKDRLDATREKVEQRNDTLRENAE